MSRGKWFGSLLLFFALIAVPIFAGSYWVSLFTQMLIFGLLAMSLDILLGYSGLPSFGHAGFFGVAAYVVAILSTRYHMGFLACLVAGPAATVATAALFGLLVGNARGNYFLMITMALGMILWGVACRWSSMTGGDNGISGVARPELGLPISLDGPAAFYYLTLVFFVVFLFLMSVFVRSPFGRTLRGLRESESRMRALGYHIWLHKYLGYVVAAFFASIPGVLWAYYNGFVSPSDLEMTGSMELFLMAILGGPGTLVGPAIGAGIVIFLKNFISAYMQRWLLVIGTIYILTILYAPDGLVNRYRERVARRKKKSLLTEEAAG